MVLSGVNHSRLNNWYIDLISMIRSTFNNLFINLNIPIDYQVITTDINTASILNSFKVFWEKFLL